MEVWGVRKRGDEKSKERVIKSVIMIKVNHMLMWRYPNDTSNLFDYYTLIKININCMSILSHTHL
jgi:hypothetical protein